MRYATGLLAGLALLLMPLFAQAQPTIDGSISGDENTYDNLAEWTQGTEDNATGFGPYGMLELYGFQDGTNVYFNTVGTIQDGSGNAFLILIDIDGQDGVPAGTAVPTASVEKGPGEKRPFDSYAAIHDFEVDYGITLRGVSDTEAAMGVIDYVSSTTADGDAPHEYLTVGEDTLFVNDGTAVTFDGGSYAGTVGSYTNVSDFSAHTGIEAWEFSMPLSAIGASGDSNFRVLAMYISGNGDFVSANTLPEIAGQAGTNLEGNPDFTGIAGEQHTSSSPLPVELTAFDAQLDGANALLTWNTASETNNAGFEVQHAAANGSFRTVGFVEGAGTTTAAQSYRFRVDDLEAGTHQFRLRQVDVDGTASFSPVRSLTVDMQRVVTMDAIAPNPVSGEASFSFATREAQPVTVTLYNLLGQEVRTLYTGTTRAGQQQPVQIRTGDLPSGTYFVRLDGTSFNETRRVTVLR